MMGNRPPIATVICNWNKKEYVLNCIKSVLEQDYANVDVFVVDNASTDGSAEAVRESYPEVNLLVNSENLGGSAGFNTGIREALKHDYKYLWLLDNDVVVDKQALTELVNFMENNEGTGMAGSKLYFMTQPDLVQEFGAWIDWEKAHVAPNKKYYSEAAEGEITENVEVDYVPACSVLVRAEAIRACGMMNETNFLYWDDMEWGFNIKQGGYKVFAVAASKVWHNMGTANKKSLLPTYYFWRNRIRFFKRYVKAGKIPDCGRDVIGALMDDVFTALFTCQVFQKNNTYAVLKQAMEDGIRNVGGAIVLQPGQDLGIDQARDYLADYSEDEKSRLQYIDLNHVILDAREEDRNNRFIVYRDKFSNVLPGDIANMYKDEYWVKKEEFTLGMKEGFYE